MHIYDTDIESNDQFPAVEAAVSITKSCGKKTVDNLLSTEQQRDKLSVNDMYWYMIDTDWMCCEANPRAVCSISLVLHAADWLKMSKSGVVVEDEDCHAKTL